MATFKRIKLNQLFTQWSPHKIATTPWLNSLGISSHLIKHYVNAGWITRIGTGAFLRSGDQITWPAAIQALQQQLKLEIHLGGESALELDGIYDQIPQGTGQNLFLYGKQGVKVPQWIYNDSFGVTPVYSKMEVFRKTPLNTFREFSKDSFSIKVSSRERAILELLHDVPLKRDLHSIRNIFLQFSTLRSTVVQSHLENCTSIKIKRLFMYLSRESNHPWYKDLDKSKISLGSGKRVIEKLGKLDPEFLITVESE